ncbi:putative GDA1/CD39 (nucleoside phosphatase) family protein [Lyophyllum shimeji]|uniref:guanosine-diphosphatase n=1 Tax=Lyophyllum shimeji TaxID=47721 RepID=A0A9P3PNN9_LYOSH|nr:putative GDA1/CD39 (nucleoside phosphatase) family protein [Lyophyllum shimeji]
MLAARLIGSGHNNQAAAIKSKSISQPPPSHSDSPSPPSSSSSATATSSQSHARKRSRIMAISPRSANYERLEGGMGVSRNPARRFAWRKFAIGAAILIGIVWFVGPREPRSLYWGAGKDKAHHYPGTEVDTSPLPSPSSTSSNTNTNTNTPSPATSFETDPDPTKTSFCTSPHTPGAPLVQYALMIDAGSTGSRIHIYKFHNCLSSPSLEWEVLNMTQPGLSSYAASPLSAAQSLDILMEEAVRVVPRELRRCAPVAVKATAGLRRLEGTQARDILEAVEERLRSAWGFPLAAQEPVAVMDGKDEGVYAWITANYLQGTLGDRKDKETGEGKGTGKEGTYAVLDLGGASTQIAFEPVDANAVLAEGDHRFELAFAGAKHVLYQHSYLGYGLMTARKHVHKLVDFMAGIRSSGAEEVREVGNPCLAKGTSRTVEVEDAKGDKRNVTMVGEEIGSFDACNRLMDMVVAKDTICKVRPCSFNGVYQPSILDTFPTGNVLLLSYFYDRMAPLLPPPSTPSATTPPSDPDTPLSIPLSAFASTARIVCEGRTAWLDHWGAQPHLMRELEGRPEWCLDLTFMYALLGRGYGFEEGREVKLAKRMEGKELGWCLGATLALVGGELRCTD